MKFLVYIVMLFLLLNSFTTSQSLIQDSCKKAASINPKLNFDFCVKSLQENLQSKTAKSIDELIIASTNNAVSKTKSLKGTLEKILKAKKYDTASEMPLRDCLELYTNAADSLNEALTSVKSRDYKTENVVLSAAMDAPTTCERNKPPVTKENDDLYQMILIP